MTVCPGPGTISSPGKVEAFAGPLTGLPSRSLVTWSIFIQQPETATHRGANEQTQPGCCLIVLETHVNDCTISNCQPLPRACLCHILSSGTPESPGTQQAEAQGLA